MGRLLRQKARMHGLSGATQCPAVVAHHARSWWSCRRERVRRWRCAHVRWQHLDGMPNRPVRKMQGMQADRIGLKQGASFALELGSPVPMAQLQQGMRVAAGCVSHRAHPMQALPSSTVALGVRRCRCLLCRTVIRNTCAWVVRKSFLRKHPHCLHLHQVHRAGLVRMVWRRFRGR